MLDFKSGTPAVCTETSFAVETYRMVINYQRSQHAAHGLHIVRRRLAPGQLLSLPTGVNAIDRYSMN